VTALRPQLGPHFPSVFSRGAKKSSPTCRSAFSERAELELLIAPVLESDVDRLADRGSPAAHVGVDVPEGVRQLRPRASVRRSALAGRRERRP
jgi:hypothetical protein